VTARRRVGGRATPRSADQASCRAARLRAWAETPAAERAAALERAGDLLEQRRGRFIHLLQVEGGKTLDDALSNCARPSTFCRYYAAQAGGSSAKASACRVPTGESNLLALARARNLRRHLAVEFPARHLSSARSPRR
jgi:RHH-type proline utilization regulon transcriptional repressor/proline dehydrogenase/delta 1-pyrroline-5-carboxylate dehydrogenase